MKLKKIKKFFRSPGVFFRDYFNKNYPIIRNEIKCPEIEEAILIEHDLQMESLIDTTIPIDIVFTWVDDADKKWQIKNKKNRDLADKENTSNYAFDSSRFSNHDELRHSIKSIEYHLPWVNKIYIVTDEQIPSWLSNNEKIKIIDHKEIINEEYLPTFNSHVIEAHLHKIPDLSEHFIYFNDDVFVARPLTASHFFKSNGIASLFLSQKSLSAMKLRGTSTSTLSASTRSAIILKKDFGMSIDTPLVHTYVPLRKSYFEKAWDLYSDEIKEFLPNKFRSNNDLNLATFFVPWLSYLNGVSYPARDICYYFNIRSASAKSNFKALKNGKINNCLPHSFCANDFHTESNRLQNCNHQLKEELDVFFKD
ncbi:capsule biosynthesis protein CapC [Pantoea sp. Al-1710]|uniref:Capsule biosynthesis protein CapC n=1 Tax=Candidatus Pantoea communis TaxID=2608354 RepID=A0ABX0RLR3_9GAMM|nr:stealth conserved region 3 domain-containing protein [Pantoea communis]NIG18555.1 capsule biosynthesis protein CapC [Pantoea communis]